MPHNDYMRSKTFRWRSWCSDLPEVKPKNKEKSAADTADKNKEKPA